MKVAISTFLLFCIVLSYNLSNAFQKICPEFCPEIFAPVCTYDCIEYCLREFSNPCFMEIANCEHNNSKN